MFVFFFFVGNLRYFKSNKIEKKDKKTEKIERLKNESLEEYCQRLHENYFTETDNDNDVIENEKVTINNVSQKFDEIRKNIVKKCKLNNNDDDSINSRKIIIKNETDERVSANKICDNNSITDLPIVDYMLNEVEKDLFNDDDSILPVEKNINNFTNIMNDGKKEVDEYVMTNGNGIKLNGSDGNSFEETPEIGNKVRSESKMMETDLKEQEDEHTVPSRPLSPVFNVNKRTENINYVKMETFVDTLSTPTSLYFSPLSESDINQSNKTVSLLLIT